MESVPEELTPRSKVKALMASMEDSDDNHDLTISKRGKENIDPEHAADGEPTGDGRDAYQRVKQLLSTRQARTMKTAGERQQETEPPDAALDLPTQQDSPETPAKSRLGTSSCSPPGLFLTPRSEGTKSVSPRSTGPKNSRFLELVARKKAEREAREAAEKKSRPELTPEESSSASEVEQPSGTARPRRRAGKKALEEMKRETQRISRNMQLAHYAQTKKKVTKDSLLARFNYGVEPSSSSTVESEQHQTPPSSPPPAMEKNWETEDLPDLDDVVQKKPQQTAKPRKIQLRISAGSDSDLEIEQPRKQVPHIFTKEPRRTMQDGRALRNLRYLAHLNSPPSKKDRNAQTAVFLQANLQARARQQAIEERKAKMEELKAKGIVLQTEEEKEKEQVEVEDLLEKARAEATAVKEKERRIADRNGEDIEFTSGEDEDWHEDREDADVELSGSEDEAASMDSEQDAEESVNENEETDPEEMVMQEENVVAEDEIGDKTASAPTQFPRKMRARRLVEDEEDDSERPVRSVPLIFQRSATQSLGMTQLFQGTMANTQSQPFSGDESGFSAPPEPYIPHLDLQSQEMVPSSQPINELIDDRSQLATQKSMPILATQISEIPDPSQDVGFGLSSPLLGPHHGEEPSSTIDTVLLSREPAKHGRLQRRSDAKNAFGAISRGAKRAARKEAFTKQQSEARGMVDEQAEESEDEYAGLGGASDDDSVEGADEAVNAMMDDTALDVNERQMAAMHA